MSSTFSDKCKKGYSWRKAHAKSKKVNRKTLLDEHNRFYISITFTSGWFVSNVMGKMVHLTALNVLRTTRAMLINLCIVSTPKCQIIISGCKVLWLFQQTFICKEIKKMKCITQSNHLLTPNFPRHPSLCLSLSVSYSGLVRMEMFILMNSVSLEDTWNFCKWKSLIIDEKCFMIWKAMLSVTTILLSKL